MQRLRSQWGLWLAAAIGGVAYGALAVLHQQEGTLRGSVTPRTISWILVAFVGFGLAVWWNEKRGISRWWLWAVPVVFRLLLLTTEPTLSDDVYRYLWDGHVATQGVSPYSYPIFAPELDPYEIPARRLANNPQLASPYLPAAHGLFAVAAAILPSRPLTMQLLMTLFDLGSAGLLVGIMTRVGLPGHRVALYLWNPIVIVEIAHGAHLDAFMIFLALLAVRLSLTGTGLRPLSPVALALATLTRPIPALLAPVLWWRWSWPLRVSFIVVTLAIVAPFGFGQGGWGLLGQPTGTGLFGSARVYSQEFRFNSGLFTWIEQSAGQLSFDPNVASKVVGALMVTILLGTWLAARRADDDLRLVRLLVVPVLGYIVLTPVFHPWYLLLAVALLTLTTPKPGECGDRWLLLLPWAYLTAASSLSYLTYRDPEAFAELDWVRNVEWWPTLSLLVATSFWVFFATQAETANETADKTAETTS